MVFWSLCFGPMMKQCIVIDSMQWKKLIHLMAGNEREKKRRAQGPTVLFDSMLSNTRRFPIRLHLLKVLPSSNSTKLRTKPLTHEPSGGHSPSSSST